VTLDEPSMARSGAPTSETVVQGERARVARAAGVLMIGVVLSRVLGLVREQVTSYFWGTTDAIAAFTIADNVHTMLFDLVISGMLQAALVPVLSAYATPERREEFRRIVGALLVWVALVVGTAVVVVAIAAPWVVLALTALGGGEAARGPETFRLTIRLVRLIVPAVLLLAFSTVLMGALYALQRFTQPSLALSVRNAAIVACALLHSGTRSVSPASSSVSCSVPSAWLPCRFGACATVFRSRTSSSGTRRSAVSSHSISRFFSDSLPTRSR
jgi:putative peptidoglycan lipid II flippase